MRACARAATAFAAPIRNSGYEFPPHRIIVNLAPADVRKAGSSFDLPIALGVLAAAGVIRRRDVDDVLILGELSLDGGIQAARGVLPIAAAARRRGIRGLLLPRANGSEAAVVDGLDFYPVRSLTEAVAALNDPATRSRCRPSPRLPTRRSRRMATSRKSAAKSLARRALEIAAAGGHNVLLAGPPGVGQDDDGEAGRGHPAAARHSTKRWR